MTFSINNLQTEWLEHLQTEFDTGYIQALLKFLHDQKSVGKTIYPNDTDVFAALNATPLSQVKLVILGQDPYHGLGQAHGLSFSVPRGLAIPPSLRNIYKELNSDLNLNTPSHGCLSAWAAQGVLLLNAVLTVEQAKAASHQNKGWERFTDRLIDIVSEQHDNLVFFLWGAYAQKKGQRIDANRHLVLRAPHPSPLSAHRGFFGCGHFSKANEYLQAHGRTTIDWQID